MNDEINAGNTGDAISDDDLLTIIRQPVDYSAEVIDGARLEAQLRGLIGRFDDADYKIVTPDGREHARLDVVMLKGLYFAGYVNREAPVFVASQNQWMPLAQVFDVSRWQATGEEPMPPPPGEQGASRRRTPPPTAVREPSFGTDYAAQQHQTHPPLAPSGALPQNTYANTPAASTVHSGAIDYTSYKGVGGWLALFVVGQLACRPVNFCGEMIRSSSIGRGNLTDIYPWASFVIGLENLLDFGMLVFGIVVGIALLRSTDSGVVTLTKKYLLTLLGVSAFDILLTAITDLPSYLKQQSLVRAFFGALFSAIYVLIWYQYFSRSKRVQATYLDEDEQGGTGFTTIGLSSKQP